VIYLRSSLFAIGYTIFTTLYGAVSLPLYLLPPLSRHRIIISWTHVVIWWAKVTCGLRYQVIGKTRVPIGERVKYARSGADIAKESGATIVPVCHNAGQYWGVDGNKFLKRPGLITVVIGEPIPSAGINTKEVISDVETWIESTLDDIVAGKIVTGKVVAEKTDS